MTKIDTAAGLQEELEGIQPRAKKLVDDLLAKIRKVVEDREEDSDGYLEFLNSEIEYRALDVTTEFIVEIHTSGKKVRTSVEGDLEEVSEKQLTAWQWIQIAAELEKMLQEPDKIEVLGPIDSDEE